MWSVRWTGYPCFGSGCGSVLNMDQDSQKKITSKKEKIRDIYLVIEKRIGNLNEGLMAFS